MRRLLALTALASLVAVPALAQSAPEPARVAAGNAVLTVSAEGHTHRAPDIATFTAGVTTDGKTAGEALSANAAAMNAVIAALKKTGAAARDIQTSNLSVNPVYGEERVDASRPQGPVRQVIVGYQASNQVSVRQRRLDAYGRTIDALVAAGANQVNGPTFGVENQDAAMDEARTEAVTIARKRADLYARAAGLRVLRVLSIAENGGGFRPPVLFARAMKADAAPSPVEAGELDLTAGVTVTYELAP